MSDDGKRTGAEILWETLAREGVDVIFGYPGGAIMPAYDAMLRSSVRHVLVRHEQGAAHMADGYARASGKVGVCIATSGPGATNLVTGIATAMLDSIPMVCVTGQVASHYIGSDAFQETDITGVTLPITKHNYLVTRVQDIAPMLREAFYVARSGRPGPRARRHHEGRAASVDAVRLGRQPGAPAGVSPGASTPRRRRSSARRTSSTGPSGRWSSAVTGSSPPARATSSWSSWRRRGCPSPRRCSASVAFPRPTRSASE